MNGAYRGVASFALLVMAWPVLEMSRPAPAVAWQAPRSGAMLRNTSSSWAELVNVLNMKIPLRSSIASTAEFRVQIWPALIVEW